MAEYSTKTEFLQIWLEFERELFMNCLRWSGGDSVTAEDIMSFCLIKGMYKYPKYKSKINNPKQWLNKLIRNACIDAYRRKKRETRLTEWLEIDQSLFQESSELIEGTPEQMLIKEEYFAKINKAIKRMPEGIGQVFVMYVLDNLSYNDIADVLDISEDTARKRVQLGRKHIRQAFGKDNTSMLN